MIRRGDGRAILLRLNSLLSTCPGSLPAFLPSVSLLLSLAMGELKLNRSNGAGMGPSEVGRARNGEICLGEYSGRAGTTIRVQMG